MCYFFVPFFLLSLLFRNIALLFLSLSLLKQYKKKYEILSKNISFMFVFIKWCVLKNFNKKIFDFLLYFFIKNTGIINNKNHQLFNYF